MFIRSERLFLRPGWPEDWTELFALIDDEAVVRDDPTTRRPDLPTTRPPLQGVSSR